MQSKKQKLMTIKLHPSLDDAFKAFHAQASKAEPHRKVSLNEVVNKLLAKALLAGGT